MRWPGSGFVVLAVIVCDAASARAQAKRGQQLEGWGEAIDPAGDCRLALASRSLLIEVPGTKHDLFGEAGDQTAPRVVRACDGDFIFQVKLAGNITHSGQRTSPQSLAYHGAGLLIWKDAREYIRLERAAIVRTDGKPQHYANFELHRDNDIAVSRSIPIPDHDTYLRLERRRDRVHALVSVDGYRWAGLDPIAAKLPRDVTIGFVAVNTSTDPLKVTFSELEVYRDEARRPTP